MTEITRSEMRECAERELKLRQRVYPRWIETNRISPAKATHELAVMEAIVKHLREYEAAGRLL